MLSWRVLACLSDGGGYTVTGGFWGDAVEQAADRLDHLAQDTSVAVRDSQARLGKVAQEAEAALIASRTTLKSIDTDVHKMTTQLKRSSDLAMQEVQATAQSLRLAGDALQNAGRSRDDIGPTWT